MIKRDWDDTNDKEELKIMEDHAEIGRKIALAYLRT